MIGFPQWLGGKESTCKTGDSGFNPWVRKIPWKRKWQPTSVFLLRNPMDREAWKTSVHGVTKELDTAQRLNNNCYDNLSISYYQRISSIILLYIGIPLKKHYVSLPNCSIQLFHYHAHFHLQFLSQNLLSQYCLPTFKPWLSAEK